MLFSHGSSVGFYNRWLCLSRNTLSGSLRPCVSPKSHGSAFISRNTKKKKKNVMCPPKVVSLHPSQVSTVRRPCRLNEPQVK